jgi:hypothetical protein
MIGINPGVDIDHPRRSLTQKLGAVLWPSFFSAAVATMVFFALFEPEELFAMVFPGKGISRELGYTFGFFLFWIATSASSVFTWILLRPASRYNRPLKGD